VRYCASCGADTEIALCVPTTSRIPGRDFAELQTLRIGLYEATAEGLTERLAPADLALKVMLPDAASLPTRVRKALGPIYEQFDRNQWRDGFRDATQLLEDRARRYLKKGIKATRIAVLDANGNVRQLTAEQIDRMTLGALAAAFERIQTPSHADTLIGQALATVNPDRVNVTHHRSKRATETQLRANVGRHMWRIVAALKELFKS
jgi:hypothetical protein